MSYPLLILIGICVTLFIYLKLRLKKPRDNSYQYLIKFLSAKNDANSRSEWITQLNQHFKKEVEDNYNKNFDDLNHEDLLDLFSAIAKQKSYATLENRTFHKNALIIIYYNLLTIIKQKNIMNDEEIKQYENEKLQEIFTTNELSHLKEE